MNTVAIAWMHVWRDEGLFEQDPCVSRTNARMIQTHRVLRAATDNVGEVYGLCVRRNGAGGIRRL
jgi:hypothetical protein